ncbi:hypothetical protein OB955_06600 [Halobacteria archaeon AArc-m2/3/4]|uniref:HVO-0234-like beta-propeller domain-containing protein n=1 Tax=Natronoglomus mannanivorans TaxID=2979990 RepID=A0ABT2QBV8_9EURY|nr:hypothetical protein [Halobacteria archaeon AArc-m2/3/4]
MSTLEEKRVYSNRQDATEAYVASAIGVVRVAVADDIVGEFSLVERCVARDVAATASTVAVATDEDVIVRSLEGASEREEENGSEDELDGKADAETFTRTDFGPATAVGFDGDDLLAAGSDGRVGRRSEDEREWETLESADTDLEVRAIDGDLVGTAGGVFRVHDGELEHAGLTDVRDVSADGIPQAATADGLYTLGNGWLEAHGREFDVVTADPASEPGTLRRAHAVSGLSVYEHADGEWLEYARTSVPVVDLAYGETVYAVTGRGTFLAASVDAGESDAIEGWRSRTLGVTDVAGVAIPSLE